MTGADCDDFYLGVDGGQSHTTALIADEKGQLQGCGHGGPSNHTRAPGGRERLESAIRDSVGAALRDARLISGEDLRNFKFRSAHLALTGEPEGKLDVAQEILAADRLVVGHDSPAALAGATAGKDGVIVIAGTGSVAYGEYRGQSARVGGRGYLFADEGSAFAIAKNAVARAIRCEDRNVDLGELKTLLLSRFNTASATDIAEEFYIERISRDQLASFALPLCELAERGNPTALEILNNAAGELAEMAEVTAVRLGIAGEKVRISFGGGVFRSSLLRERFVFLVRERIPMADVLAPCFGAEVGALLLAYRNAGIAITSQLIEFLQAGIRKLGES